MFWPEGHWGLRNEVGSLSLAERLVKFESETFQFIWNTSSWKPPSWDFQDDLFDSSIMLKFSNIYIIFLFPNETTVT